MKKVTSQSMRIGFARSGWSTRPSQNDQMGREGKQLVLVRRERLV
jgi:hypothetical protein